MPKQGENMSKGAVGDFDNIELVDFEAGMSEEMAREAFRRCGVYPMLLETCKTVLDSLNGSGEAMNDNDRRDVLRQAIAKAEGRT